MPTRKKKKIHRPRRDFFEPLQPEAKFFGPPFMDPVGGYPIPLEQGVVVGVPPSPLRGGGTNCFTGHQKVGVEKIKFFVEPIFLI